jgi:hypothetical protein
MNTNNITKAQISCIHALHSKLRIGMEKAELVRGFSNGRTTSMREMTVDEGTALIKELKRQDPEEIAANRMRNKIISMGHEMGWRLPNTTKIYMAHIDSWCMSYGLYKKKLNSHTLEELPHLVTQMEAVYKSFIKGI